MRRNLRCDAWHNIPNGDSTKGWGATMVSTNWLCGMQPEVQNVTKGHALECLGRSLKHLAPCLWTCRWDIGTTTAIHTKGWIVHKLLLLQRPKQFHILLDSIAASFIFGKWSSRKAIGKIAFLIFFSHSNSRATATAFGFQCFPHFYAGTGSCCRSSWCSRRRLSPSLGHCGRHFPQACRRRVQAGQALCWLRRDGNLKTIATCKFGFSVQKQGVKGKSMPKRTLL